MPFFLAVFSRHGQAFRTLICLRRHDFDVQGSNREKSKPAGCDDIDPVADAVMLQNLFRGERAHGVFGP
jgi:hypothetical protein